MNTFSNLFQKIDRDIAAQLKKLGIGEKRTQKHPFPCITISREFGCEGIPVAQLLVKKLSTEEYPWVLFHRELISEMTEKEKIRDDLIESISPEYRGLLHQYIEHLLAHKPSNVQLYKKMAETLRLLGLRGRSVILGSGAAILTADLKHMLHVRLQAPIEFRIKRVSRELNLTVSEARERIISKDSRREEFIFEFTHKDVRDPKHYNLIFDNSIFDSNQIVELIHHSLVLRKMLPTL